MLILYYIERNRDMNATPRPDPAKASPAPLCPIPRNGISGAAGILLSILLTIASAMVGICPYALARSTESEPLFAQITSVGVLLLLVLYLWRVTKSAKGLLPILIFSGVAIYYFTGSLIFTASVCSLLFAVGEGSFLLAVLPRKQWAWIPLIPIVAYAAALALTRDPFSSASALVPFPPMVVLALGTRNSAEKEDGLTRVGVICATSLALGLSLIAAGALTFYHELGTISPEAVAKEMDIIRNAIIEEITSAEIPEGFDPEMLAELEKMLTYANAENTVNSVFNLLPALFVAVVNILAACAQTFQHATLRTFGMEASLTDRVRAFRMSLISCIVFLGAYLITFLENSVVSTLTGTVAQNIYIILLPGLALAGMLRIMNALARKGPRGLGCLFYLVLLIPCMLLFAPVVLAAVEVIGHLFSAITTAIKPSDDDDPFGNP